MEKRLIAVILLLVICLGLVACGREDRDDEDNDARKTQRPSSLVDGIVETTPKKHTGMVAATAATEPKETLAPVDHSVREIELLIAELLQQYLEEYDYRTYYMIEDESYIDPVELVDLLEHYRNCLDTYHGDDHGAYHFSLIHIEQLIDTVIGLDPEYFDLSFYITGEDIIKEKKEQLAAAIEYLNKGPYSAENFDCYNEYCPGR